MTNQSNSPPPRNNGFRRLPTSIWVLGFVSMMMDISSEMVHALLPVYLVAVLGASAVTVGLIEGVAEATASITRVFSGALSDWLGKRKLLAALGYGLAACTKPVFPLAQSIGLIFAARFIDRIGKGIRGAPRDALIADIAPPDLRGASFGLRQSLDTVGAFLGPALAVLLMALSGDDYGFVFWIAVIPAFLAFGLIAFAVREPARTATAARPRLPLHPSEVARLGPAYWLIATVAAVFTLARFSEAFLILRAQSVGMPVALVPVVLIAMNVVYALAAYPAGVLSDGIGRLKLLVAGFGVLILSNVVLAFAASSTPVLLGAALWGLHMGLTQGLLAALVADTAPAELRGTAYGFFNLLGGGALLLASVIAGLLWDAVGPSGTFLAGAGLTASALIGLVAVRGAVGRLDGNRPGSENSDGR